jgi:hypothetical protein
MRTRTHPSTLARIGSSLVAALIAAPARGADHVAGNLERQRKFRASHPNYFSKYNARRKALRRYSEANLPAIMAANAAAEAAQTPPAPLLLPAAAEMPIIPGMNTITATPAQEPLAISLPVATAGGRAIPA